VSALVVGSLVVFWLGSHWAARRSAVQRAFPTHSGELRLSGPTSSLEVLRDARGIPHVRADHERDAWFALGFVHAQDRLAQMLWLRRLARGRSAEVAGEPGLPGDRLARTLGIGRLADQQAARLPSAAAEALEAYARGVNARLERLASDKAGTPLAIAGWPRPLAPWTPGDSLAVVKLISWATGAELETGLVLSDLIERLGGVAARPFFPGSGSVRGLRLPVNLPERQTGLRPESPAPVIPDRADTRLHSALLGGSAWVVDGASTASGAPLIAADFHLAPTAPSLVYQIRLQGGELNVAGVTVPGVPIFWAGRNRHVAWAATPARAVTADLLQVTLSEADASHFYQSGRWEPLQVRTEAIAVRRARGDVEKLRFAVRSTIHGPLVNPLLSSQREPLSLSWSGAWPGEGISSMLGVAHATSAEQLREALREHHEPVVAMVYADRSGAGGLKVAGWIPRRVLPTIQIPVPARMRAFHWHKPVDFEALPDRRLERNRPWVVAADNSFPQGHGSHRIEWLWRNGRRAGLIEQLLSERLESAPMDAQSAGALQRERIGADAREQVALILALAGERAALSPGAREIAELLEGWDGRLLSQSSAAAAYRVLQQHLIRSLFEAPLGERLLARFLALAAAPAEALVEQILRNAAGSPRPAGWSDPVLVRAAVRRGLHQTWVSLGYRLGPNRANWGWGRLHRISFRPFGSLEPGAPAAGPKLGPLAAAGDDSSPWMADSGDSRSGGTEGFFDVRLASTCLLVMDLGVDESVWTALVPGQSEHPGHPNFDDGLEDWLTDGLTPLSFDPTAVEGVEVERLLIEPAP
jgi:penicillin amidase